MGQETPNLVFDEAVSSESEADNRFDHQDRVVKNQGEGKPHSDLKHYPGRETVNCTFGKTKIAFGIQDLETGRNL